MPWNREPKVRRIRNTTAERHSEAQSEGVLLALLAVCQLPLGIVADQSLNAAAYCDRAGRIPARIAVPAAEATYNPTARMPTYLWHAGTAASLSLPMK